MGFPNTTYLGNDIQFCLYPIAFGIMLAEIDIPFVLEISFTGRMTT